MPKIKYSKEQLETLSAVKNGLSEISQINKLLASEHVSVCCEANGTKYTLPFHEERARNLLITRKKAVIKKVTTYYEKGKIELANEELELLTE